MATAPIDYAALAKQARGVDYAAMAEQARKTPPTPPLPVLDGAKQRLLGSNPLQDIANTVGSSLKNLVAGPYNAFHEGPQNAEEAQIKGTAATSGPANALGQFGLGAARMLVQPTRTALRDMVTQAKAGNFAGNNYDDQGNYKPSAISSAMDALPLAGPEARKIENDAQKHGGVPALLGGGVDLAGAAAGSKLSGLVGDAANTTRQFGPAAAVKGALTDIVAPGSPAKLLQRALKPNLKVSDPLGKLGSTAQDIMDAAPTRPTTVSQYADAADLARNAQHGKFQSILDPIGDQPVSTQSVADTMRGSVSRAHQIEDPINGSIDAANTHAGVYDDQFAGPTPSNRMQPQLTLKDLNDVRSTKNAQLQNIFADTPADRASVLKANPTAARLMATRDAAADTQYSTMSGLSGIPQDVIEGIQKKYGNLAEVSDVANKRDTIYGRQEPVSLAEGIGFGHSIQSFLANRLLKNITGSDALIDAATRKTMLQPLNPAPSGLKTLPALPLTYDRKR